MIEDQLRYILGFVDSHVRFGEAKNAAAFVAAGGTAVAAVTTLLAEDSVGRVATAYLMMAWILSLFAAVICVVSFLPRTHLPWLRDLDPPSETDNLLFFGHVQKYAPEKYWEAVAGPDVTNGMSRVEFCICEQIVINARIASRKFTLFKYAAWVLLSALISPIGAVAVFAWIRDPNA